MTESRKEQMRAYIYERRAERRKNGMCTECGEPVGDRYTRCFSCRRKNAKYQADHRKRQCGMIGGKAYG